MAQVDGWTEYAKISIARVNVSGPSGLDVSFAALTDTIDMDRGEKDIEVFTMLNGANRVKRTSEGATAITFEGYPLGIKAYDTETASPTADLGVDQLFNGGTFDTTTPYVSEPSLERGPEEKYRITLLWTDDKSNTAAHTSVLSGMNAIRHAYANAYMTACKPSFTDKVLKYTFSFKLPPFDETGDPNIHSESVSAVDVAHLQAYPGFSTMSGVTIKW